jgi:hypothetical protein
VRAPPLIGFRWRWIYILQNVLGDTPVINFKCDTGTKDFDSKDLWPPMLVAAPHHSNEIFFWKRACIEASGHGEPSQAVKSAERRNGIMEGEETHLCQLRVGVGVERQGINRNTPWRAARSKVKVTGLLSLSSRSHNPHSLAEVITSGHSQRIHDYR